MTHEGRMARGKKNSDSGILLENADTLYYLNNKPADETKQEKKKSGKS
jgi:hypothetical protein